MMGSMRESMRVAVELSAPMQLPEHPIHLDGLLSALHVQRLEEAGHSDPWSQQHSLPLARYVAPDGEWCFKASLFSGVPAMEPFFSPLAYRANLAQVAEDRGIGLLALRSAKANTAGGPFRAGIHLKPMAWVPKLEAYAMGDVAAVRDLLSGLKFIGPGRSRAAGRVHAVTVEHVPEESLRWAQRALPAACDLPLPFAMALCAGTLRAPYWKRRLATKTLLPEGC
jgi:CRISPR type IV-associated protein Csf3